MSLDPHTFILKFDNQRLPIDKQINLFNKEWLKNHESKSNLFLYHYTSFDGLKGIINNRAIWFSHAKNLDDPLEIQHGKKLVFQTIKYFKEKESTQEICTFYNRLMRYLKNFDDKLYSPFIACFCQTDNSSSQWKTYGDSGGGYCIGFEISKQTRISLQSVQLNKLYKPVLRKVIYSEDKQNYYIHKFISQISKKVKEALANRRKDNIPEGYPYVDKMSSKAVNVLFDMILSFKHKNFKKEKEWRLIKTTRNDFLQEELNYRPTSKGKIPYRSIYICNQNSNGERNFPIKSIKLGPSLDFAKNKKNVELFLNKTTSLNREVGINRQQIEVN